MIPLVKGHAEEADRWSASLGKFVVVVFGEVLPDDGRHVGVSIQAGMECPEDRERGWREGCQQERTELVEAIDVGLDSGDGVGVYGDV